jgi:hypothetical protein
MFAPGEDAFSATPCNIAVAWRQPPIFVAADAAPIAWGRVMNLRILALPFAILLSTAAFADCTDDVCGSVQKIFQARSGNFAQLKGKPSVAPKGDPLWEGTQTIPGLLNYCYVYARGEGAHYEYRCDTSALGNAASLSLEAAKRFAERVKSAFQSADPKLLWFVDPDAIALAKIDGFEASEAWYGGYAPNKLAVKVAIFGSPSGGSTVTAAVFAKPLVRRDVK